jgi:hypothetical protein
MNPESRMRELRCVLCKSEKDVTALPTSPAYVSACRATFGIAPTPTGLCAECRALPLCVPEDTVTG